MSVLCVTHPVNTMTGARSHAHTSAAGLLLPERGQVGTNYVYINVYSLVKLLPIFFLFSFFFCPPHTVVSRSSKM